MSQNLSDDRIKKSGRPDQRVTADFTRAAAEDSLAGGEQVRKRAFRDEFSFEALPTPPALPGWHYCWVSTTNPQDPPHRRIRMGYIPVRAEEIEGFEHLRLKSGEWEGCVSMNEMLLFKIPMETYQAIMEEFHHIAPNEEEERLRQDLPDVKDSSGQPLIKVLTDSDAYGKPAARTPFE